MSSGKSRKSARAGKVPTRPSGGLIGEIEAYLRRSSAKPPLREDGEGLSRNCDEESDTETRSVRSGRDSSERGPEGVEQAESSSVEFVEKGTRSPFSVDSAGREVVDLKSDEDGELYDDRDLDPFRQWSKQSHLSEPSDGGIPRVRSFREEQRYRDELIAKASAERTSVIEEIFRVYKSSARRPLIGSRLRAALASPSEELNAAESELCSSFIRRLCHRFRQSRGLFRWCFEHIRKHNRGGKRRQDFLQGIRVSFREGNSFKAFQSVFMSSRKAMRSLGAEEYKRSDFRCRPARPPKPRCKGG